jgi:RNA polymerase sigma-70 factor (ECF subfamily)
VTDDELVALARRGDTAAFGELADRHQAAVFRTALIVCRSPEEAEEIAQEALVHAWRKLAGYRGDAQFKTWLLTIAWRQALSRRRSSWLRLRRFVHVEDPLLQPRDTQRSAEEQLGWSEIVAEVRRTVNALPDKLRRPLLLAASGDCTFEEMSAMLGVPSGTLKWRVMEARRKVKRTLAARGIAWT